MATQEIELLTKEELPLKEVSEEKKSDCERETWGRKSEFILALLGYSVGLGNVWRFPYLCYKNGGGAFLIPYVIFVLLAGIPMFFLEISLGQFWKRSAVGIWKLAPSMKGIGYGSAVINGLCAIYYVLVMAWSCLYLTHSCLPGPLPWTTCDNWWNTENCVSHWEVQGNTNITENITALNVSNYNSENVTSPEMEFWKNYVLRQSSGIDNLGSMENWPLTLCFLASWLVIYFCVFKGVHSSGKVVYVTATLPYIMLFVILVRGLTLEGAWDGIKYLFRPDFSKLKSAQVWVDAGGQIFYSYGICFTVLITFGSYNRFHNDCYKQSIILASTCSLTSLLASVTIFSILGHMALVQSKSIAEVATQGPGLVFLVYPTGLSLLPLPRLWTIIFFITLFLVGIDTQFAGVEGTIAVIVEKFPWSNKGKHGREKVSALIAFGFLLAGLPLLTQGGIYVFELFNMYAVSGICLLFVTFFQSIAIGWVYGVDRYFDDVKSMIGYYPSAYFKLCYRFFTPMLTMLIFLFYCIKYVPLELDGYAYPAWANAIGWMMSLASMLCIPCCYILYLKKSSGSLKTRLIASVRPSSESVLPRTISQKA